MWRLGVEGERADLQHDDCRFRMFGLYHLGMTGSKGVNACTV